MFMTKEIKIPKNSKKKHNKKNDKLKDALRENLLRRKQDNNS